MILRAEARQVGKKSAVDWTATENPVLEEDPDRLKQALIDHMIRHVATDPSRATKWDWFSTLSDLVRGYMAERWVDTRRRCSEEGAKVVCYLSMEFLLGRSLKSHLINLGLDDRCREALKRLDVDLDELYECETEPALGNGGLGRLAACVIESLATQGYPAYGYGIRYVYGMFRQSIQNGWQIEQPENWLSVAGDPWEFPQPGKHFTIRFGGRVVKYKDHSGEVCSHWADTDDIRATAYDVLVSGYDNETVNSIRLWSARATREFDLRYFHEGDYEKAVRDKNDSENLSRVLYPDDTTHEGRQLRLKQEYFFVSASLQDILARHLECYDSLEGLPDRVSIQLNDTHPALAIPEMMRLLTDMQGMTWDKAWDITTGTVAYTNHTLLPEALETWPVPMFQELLPRHLEIIYEINDWLMRYAEQRAPGDEELRNRVSIIDEHGERHVRMANLAIVGSHKVNGVSALHADLMRKSVFASFDQLFPGRIVGKTNGITPRRWLIQANRKLADLISSRVGRGWETRLEQVEGLLPLANDRDFQEEFRAIKRANKQRLAILIRQRLGIEIDPLSMFDMQIKRIHEYKRQLLNILQVIARFNRIRDGGGSDLVPHTVIFGGKAAPGYFMAKRVIKLITSVASVVDAEPRAAGLLKVVFVPNYSVSWAENLIPAADLSQQLSTAGTEASGTGNMKLALNGALTIGTRDGANIEIGQEVGEDNIFFFGMGLDEVAQLRNEGGYDPWAIYHEQPELRQALDMVRDGYFSHDEHDLFRPVFDSLTAGGDWFMVLADFAAYLQCLAEVDAVYRDSTEWTRRAIVNVAKMGSFASDRMVREYADEIWRVRPLNGRKRDD
jgi:starch phosphorylase